MTDDGRVAQLLELADSLRQRWWLPVTGLCLGLSAALVALHTLPKTYEAATKILVAPQRMAPPDMPKSAASDEQALRIAALREALSSRPLLVAAIEKVYGAQPNDLVRDELVLGVRSRLTLDTGNYPVGGTGPAGYFAITYLDNDPDTAAAFVNSLVQVYIDENETHLAERASESRETFDALAATSGRELEVREREIAQFKASHMFETSAQLDANLRMLEGRQKDLEANRREIQAALDRVQLLRAQQSSLGRIVPGGDANADPYTARMTLLRKELDSLRARYQETHPDVLAKKRELDEFLATARPGAKPSGDSGETTTGVPSGSVFTATLEQQEREVVRLREAQQRIQADIALYAARIDATPRTEQRLTELSKGYDVLSKQYLEYKTKAEAARGSQAIQEKYRGAQFEVLERAVASPIPVAPRPARVLAIGLVLGLLGCVGPLVVRELVNPITRSESVLASVYDVPIMVSIPRVDTPTVQHDEQRRARLNVVLATVAVLTLAIVWLGTR